MDQDETQYASLAGALTLAAPSRPHIAGYELLDVIGRGGMGVVVAARDNQSGSRVAIKMMRTGSAGRLERERFSREATILAELRHPGIVSYIDHGLTEEGHAYLVMEWLEGVDLSQRLKAGRLTIDETRELGIRVCEALQVAHDAGIVHRDIKPANIFLVDGRTDNARVLDFGVARLVDLASSLTKTGGLVGTPGYMSPEQVRGEADIDVRTDLFSLGCILYECLAGLPAFHGNQIVAVLAKVLMEDPRRLREVAPGVSPELASLVHRLLDKERTGRPSSSGKSRSLSTRSIHA